MSDNPKPLKSQNMNYILSILSLDIIVITLVLSNLNITPLPKLWILTLSNGVGATTVIVFALVANHLLPRWLKEIIVFLRIRDVQPGCRAFSVHAKKDKRIDEPALLKIVGSFPSAANEQNALWYKLFKKNEDKTPIRYAHKNYLLFRDLAALSLMLILASLTLVVYKPCTTTASLSGWFLLQYLLSMIAAQNSGNSLVDNVLAEASST